MSPASLASGSRTSSCERSPQTSRRMRCVVLAESYTSSYRQLSKVLRGRKDRREDQSEDRKGEMVKTVRTDEQFVVREVALASPERACRMHGSRQLSTSSFAPTPSFVKGRVGTSSVTLEVDDERS